MDKRINEGMNEKKQTNERHGCIDNVCMYIMLILNVWNFAGMTKLTN